MIVTFDVRDFPDSATHPYDIRVIHPDDFLLDQLDLYPAIAVDCLRAQTAAYTHPTLTTGELLDALSAAGVPDFAPAARMAMDA